MKAIIQNKLQQIEQDEDIKILYACESGSRGWGFPSPDSDFDVRFIYVHPYEKYLSVRRPTEQFTFPINDELDIGGWDLLKVLQLIAKSNTTPFEWLQSPIIYKEDKAFKEDLWQLCQHYFCPRSNIHHYLGVAQGAMETMQDENIKIKKLFYVLRPSLAALWCAARKTIAPMHISRLMELLSVDLHKEILSLIDLKSTAVEGHMIKIKPDLKQWIDLTFSYCQGVLQPLERKTFNIEELDRFFRKIIIPK